MAQEYIVGEVVSEKEAQFGKKNFRVKFEGDDRTVGMFSQFPIFVGKKLYGEIVQKGQYLNFNFVKQEKRDMSPAANNGATAEIKNILDHKVITRLDRHAHLLELICRQLDIETDPAGYNTKKMDQQANDMPF